jgi:transcription elongation factor Elf1
MTRQKRRRQALARHRDGKLSRALLCERCKEPHFTVKAIPTHAGLVFKCQRCRVEHARERSEELVASFRDIYGYNPTPEQLAEFDAELRGYRQLAQEGALQ